MLEKYITPLLMSYVDKYIKNLSPNDLGVSLWGGDVLLKNLELKLDVLEQEFLFPVRFLSGRIHELKIHIPWTSLGSDSVIITLNTLECSLTYRPIQTKKHVDLEAQQEDTEDKESDSGISDASGQQAVAPSYVQLLTQRILNNVEIHVNNLIFKYIEDDIVLSVNIKSACMYTVNSQWEQEFSDITGPEYSLRRVIELVDLTVCLDHLSASGRIEVYEEPVLYRAHINCRSLFTFPNSYSFSPSAIFVHVLCDEINLNLSDQQFPSLITLLRRLYYLTNSSDTTKQVVHPAPPPVMSAEEEGWIGWGWSMLGMSAYSEDYRVSPAPPAEMLFNFSLFVKVFNISCTKVLHHRRKRSAKFQFAPFMSLQIRGMAVAAVAKGYYYSDFNLGVCSITADLTHHKERVFQCGDATSGLENLAEWSLFDVTPLLDYEDKRHATEGETLSFTKFRAIWLCALNVIPEFKQRQLDELDQLERCEGSTELYELRVLVNKFTGFLNNNILTSLQLYFSSKTASALFDPLPCQPSPKRAVSTTRLHVMSHVGVTCHGALVFLSGSNMREPDGTHEVCMFYSCSRVDLDQHAPLWVSQLTKLGPQHSLTNKLCYTSYALRVEDNSAGYCSVRDLKTIAGIVILPGTFLQTVVRVYCYPASWVSTIQGLLEVRLEVPQITLMLTMPQLHLLAHFVTYWCNKLGGVAGAEQGLHGAALKGLCDSALNIEEQLSVELCVSSVGIKYCKTAVVNSTMFTVRGAEIFLYKTTEEAVCVMSGPYFTNYVHRSLEQPTDVHVVPALLHLTLQWPHNTYTDTEASTPSDRPVLIVHTSGLIFCWDHALPAFLAFQPPANVQPYVRSGSPESLSMRSSTPASSTPASSTFTTPVTTPSALRVELGGSPVPGSPGETRTSPSEPHVSPAPSRDSPDDVTTTSPSWWNVLQYLAVQVEISPIILTLDSGGCGSPQGDVIEYLQNCATSDIVMVCLPGVELGNQSTTTGLLTPQELPLLVTTTGGLVGDPSQYTALPWTIALDNMAVTTLRGGVVQSILTPVVIKVVLALGSRGCNDVCLHADTQPIAVHVDLEQIKLVLRVINTLSSSFAVTLPTDVPNTPSIFSTTATGSETSSVHTYLPDLHYEPIQLAGDPGDPYLYVWLQYAIPKITVSLNGTCSLTAEDITASVDLEGLLLTKKLKVGTLKLGVVCDKDEVTLLQSQRSDPALSIAHCNNYMRNAQPSYFVKVKPLQVLLDQSAVFTLTDLLQKSIQFPLTKATEAPQPDHTVLTPTTLNTLSYPDLKMEIQDLEIICPVPNEDLLDNEITCHISLITISSSPDNMLSRVIIDKGYHKHIKSTETHSRCNYQLQVELTGLEVYTDRTTPPQPVQDITNAAEAWSQRRLSSNEDPTATIVQGADLRATFAPGVTATRSQNIFGIYGTSLEIHLDPQNVFVSLDQIQLVSRLAGNLTSNLPPRDIPRDVPRDITRDLTRDPASPNRTDCYDAMIALNRLTLLLYERSKDPTSALTMFSILECSLEQCVLSACSLPAEDTIRASVFTAHLAIATQRTGVTYDGDLSCPTKVLSPLAPNSHTPFITLAKVTDSKKDVLKVDIKHDIEINLEVDYIEPILNALDKIYPANTDKPAAERSSTPFSLPAANIHLHHQSIKLRLCELVCGIHKLAASFEQRDSTNLGGSIECTGVYVTTVTDESLVAPFDTKISSKYNTVSKDITNNVYVPCCYGRLGQNHLTLLQDLTQKLYKYFNTASSTPPPPPPLFTTHHHDDIRSSGYKFVILEHSRKHVVTEGTVVFSADDAAITWRYPEKRSIVALVSLPVLLACDQQDGIQCTLSYYDEFTKGYVKYVEFVVSQVDVASFRLPTHGVRAHQWRVSMELDVEIWEEATEEDAGQVEGNVLDWKEVELSSYPALSLAGCLCVDSISTRTPTSTTTVYCSEAELTLCHHHDSEKGLTVKGKPISLPDSELELMRLVLRNVSGRIEADNSDTSLQGRCGAELYHLDYSHLLYTLLARCQGHLTHVSRDQPLSGDVTDNVLLLADMTTKTSSTLLLSSSLLCLTPSLLTTLDHVTRTWGSRDNVVLFRTLVVNETDHPAQLMMNGNKYLPCPVHSSVACYWNPTHPVFLALESVHPSWSAPLELKTGGIVEDSGVFVMVEQDPDYTYISITGGVSVNNRTILDLQCSFLPLEPATSSSLKVQDVGPNEQDKCFTLGVGEHAMSFAMKIGDPVHWSQPVRLHKDLPDSFVATLAPDIFIIVSSSHRAGHFTINLSPLFVIRNNFAEQLMVNLSSPDQGVSRTVKLGGGGAEEQIFFLNNSSVHNIGCKLHPSLPLSIPVSSWSYPSITSLPTCSDSDTPWPAYDQVEGAEVRNILVPHDTFTDWSLEAEIHLSRASLDKHTVQVDWWPCCLISNDTSLTLHLRGSNSSPPVSLTPTSYKSGFSLKGKQLYVGVSETDDDVTDVIMWSPVIDISGAEKSGAKKSGKSYEIFKEVEIQGLSKDCHVVLHCEIRDKITLVRIRAPLVLTVDIHGLYLRKGGEVVQVGEDEYSEELYWWKDTVKVEMGFKQSTSWSFPADLRRLSPRKGMNVVSDKPCSPLPVVVCSVDHRATTYVAITRNSSPQIYLTNYSEFNFIVSEHLPPSLTPGSVRVDGDKTQLLRPFRSSYFDPYSTTDKLFIQDINENDFVPQLSFAFYRPHDTAPITSHQVNLSSSSSSSSPSSQVLQIDPDNSVLMGVESRDNVVHVTIRSEFMTSPARDPAPAPSSQASYLLDITQADVLVFTERDVLAAQVRLSGVTCHVRPDTSHVTNPPSHVINPRQEISLQVEDIQLDNSLTDQTYDFPVVMFTDKAVRADQAPSHVPFLRTLVSFHDQGHPHAIHHFHFQMGQIHVHLEDLFLYQLAEVLGGYVARVGGRAAQGVSRDTSRGVPEVVRSLMAELYEPLSVEQFIISSIDIELGVHASVKLFLAADSIPLKFREFRINKLFTLTQHFSEVLLSKYVSDTILQAGWALASLDLLGSPGLMIRSTFHGVRDMVVLPYDGLTRGPSAFVSGIAAGSASLARNIGTGVITSITNLAVSISRNMDRMSLDSGHTKVCAMHRRAYKASHIGSGLTKGLSGLGIHLLSAVAGLVQQPIQDMEEREGVVEVTKGLMTGVSKGMIGMVTKPLGGAAELVANTGEGLLTGAGWILSPVTLLPGITKPFRTDSKIRVSLELLQLSTSDKLHFVQCSVNPISIYVVVSSDKIFLLLGTIKQCFSRDSIRLVFEQSSVTIYSTSSLEKGADSPPGSLLDRTLLEKINKMYNLAEQPAPATSGSSDLIATLPLDFPKGVLLQNLLS